MQAKILRQKFLDYFKARHHKIVEPDSLVPKDDPTILFTPAGMNQFKKEFLGFDSGFRRAATAQRCLRTDDLDKVGKTSGHHTFFEMLGNFSFGDYFKKEAISFAWDFLTQELKINKDKLWVSVYKDDAEAYKIWKDSIKIPAERIVKLGDKENFWPSEAKELGPNGPCGPCSEIFFDFGKNNGCLKPGCNPACGCFRFVEIWNLVFTQFNRKEGGKLTALPNKNIDTGMGLERLAAVMQGARNNFETDLFQPIIKEIVSGIKERTPGDLEMIYAISDHLRGAAFSIYDGVMPSNDARGYIVRKLIRKSSLHLRSMGITQPFMYKLVSALSETMKDFYPELDARRENISEIILAEENNFIATLANSEALFREKFKGLSENKDPVKTGRIAFKLYDTYGMPLELTEAYLKKEGLSFSREEFDKELKEQKTRSKLQSAMKGDVFSLNETDYGVKETKFLGYKEFFTKAKVVNLFKDGVLIKRINQGETASVILDNSVFYPESGGQIGDSGELKKGKNIFEVLETQRSGKVILHVGRVKAGSFKKNDLVSAQIDAGRRLSIARNHTATHLLQAALRKVLGAHVQQQGSSVEENRLRFDFTHFKDIAKEELDRIEEIVNLSIINNYPLLKKEMPLAEAKKSGALAFFGEKYEGRVRVVSIADFSREFCGGTHLDATGQIGLFKIVHEGSISSGVRRIEARTGIHAYKTIKYSEEVMGDISLALNVPMDKIKQELQKRLSWAKVAEKQLHAQKTDSLKSTIDADIQNAQMINNVRLVIHLDTNPDSARKAVDLIKERLKDNSVIVSSTGANLQNKIFCAIGVTVDLCEKGFDASKLIKEIASEISGSSGGRRDFAQAGGTDPGKFENAVGKLIEVIKKLK